MNIKIIGCGLTGITCARILKNKGHLVQIYEKRNHIGGNCYDSIVAGTLVHSYGPHIFHTDDKEVYDFLTEHTEWIPFELRPKGNTDLGLISLPYSQKTIKEIGRELTLEEIIKYIFKDYSEKQWGMPFEKIPNSITNRIPKTKDMENPTWFEGQKYQCIPKLGYTHMLNNILKGIDVHLNVKNNEWKDIQSDITIYTGKIDEYFNYSLGSLPYRSLEFKHTMTEKYMDCVIENQNNNRVQYTRKYDHRFFTINHQGTTIITEEYPIEYNTNNIPFYPIPLQENIDKYNEYKKLAEKENNIIFAGRLGTYKYLDMHQAIRNAINITKEII